MSWIEKLFRTYENCATSIGDSRSGIPLLPVCHTTQKAQVTVVLSDGGDFLRASVVPKDDGRTIIPATEESAGRTSSTVPHPLCDKLQYVAGDYEGFGGMKKACFLDYADQLDKWCSSPFADARVCAVWRYVVKKQVIRDLVRAKVLYVDRSGKLADKSSFDTNSAPDIFRVLQGDGAQADAFVRFSVEIAGEPQANLWSDSRVWDSWTKYYGTLRSTKGLCFVTGEEAFLADQHPAKIRNDGDKAKLISSNDTSGFTFRGRFLSSDEACGVGFEVTQKAHNALRWLIARQGWRDGDQAIVAWAVSCVEVPDPLADTLALLSKRHQDMAPQGAGYTAQETGIALSKLIAGYSAKLGSTEEVVVMGLDSSTPGRMAISFYRELTSSEFLQRVQAWHQGCIWQQYFGKDRVFVGAPSPRDIAECAYGRRLDDKLRKSSNQRLLPCIVDGVPIPRDLVESCVRRASSRQGIDHWEWEKALGIACALYNQQNRERNYSMALDRERRTRDYLYGRLLALAERLEGYALYVAGEQRETNAARLMQRFADRPYSTWLTIETSLTPYKVRLRTRRPGFLYSIEKEIDEIAKSFVADDFISDRRLSGEFLLGYHCQRAELHVKPDKNDEPDTDDDSNESND